ncbi:hypothetical protein [Bosea sp. AS-1]|uniref:hypothetical protein n=1 Tax=Bosea sp. AS-1 TaxID=2015316 RepID=UPI000B77D9D9|nr:hypothetical protein [Bosea sp. AS-1]
MAILNSERDLLRDYALTDKRQFLERQAAAHWTPPATNPYAAARNEFVEHVVVPAMDRRSIRAWHYTRLTEDETALLRTGGVYTSNLETIRRRLDVQVSAGVLSPEIADALFAASPFHQQNDSRSGKFWMTSHPMSADNGLVELLLEHWGGEGVYFWLEDPELVELVKSFGRPRILELAVPLETTSHSYPAAKAVVASFVRSLGCEAEWPAFDLYTKAALAPDAVLGVHTQGEPNFAALARGYPAEFVDREW